MAFHQTSTRAGRYIKQPTGYEAFIPSALPPRPAIKLDDGLLDVLSKADRAIGRLDGCTETLPDSDLFVFMYIRKEAVLSSQTPGLPITPDVLGEIRFGPATVGRGDEMIWG